MLPIFASVGICQICSLLSLSVLLKKQKTETPTERNAHIVQLLINHPGCAAGTAWQIVENRFQCLMMLPAGLVWESRATFGSIKDNPNWKGWGQFKDNLPFFWLPTFKRIAQLAVVKLVLGFTETSLQWLLPIRAWNAECLVEFLWVLFLSCLFISRRRHEWGKLLKEGKWVSLLNPVSSNRLTWKTLPKKNQPTPNQINSWKSLLVRLWRLLKNRMWWSSQWRIETLGLH